MDKPETPEEPHIALKRVYSQFYGLGGQKQAAKAVGIGAPYFGDLLKGNRAISPQVALKLEKAGWGAAEDWLWTQMRYDLWKLRQEGETAE